MRQAARRKRTTTIEQDEAQAVAAAMAPAAMAEPAEVTPGAAAPLPDDASDDPSVTSMAATVTAAACPSSQFEWPSGTGYCWYKRDTGNQLQGPGPNLFKQSNVAVNSAGSLVLTISNPNNK